MSATVESVLTVQRPVSWRDELGAEHEMIQVRLRCLLADDEPEEYL
ncbi:hypothetical protein [Georgenia wutianyii]|nr:hypothetical protein [Georgenia wutianyii]